jgi:phospholipid/cholesterol/gamma-HCH transport system ATP-binding protein
VRRTQQNFALTVVMVSHDVPQVFEVSDQIAYMNGGKIELAGSASEVMSADNQNFKRFLAGKALDEDELLSTGAVVAAAR